MCFTPVPDDVALTFGSRDGILFFTSLAMYGSVTVCGSELHPLGFLASSTPAAGKDATLVGGRLLVPAWLVLHFALLL